MFHKSKLQCLYFLLFAGTLLSTPACQSENESSLTEQFQSVEVSEQLTGVDLGKYDQSEAITDWLLKENQQYSMLEGRNLDGKLTFAAILEKNPESEETKIELAGEQNCSFTINLISMEVRQSTCSAEAIAALEIPTVQLLGTFDPLLADDKADRLLTRIACVGAGIGASVLSLIVWQFASGVALASTSVSTVTPILVASSSVIGAVALCYTAFAEKSEFSTCVSDCDEDLQCVELCVNNAKVAQQSSLDEEASAVAAAGQVLQCIGSCEAGEACDSLCYEILESVEASHHESP